MWTTHCSVSCLFNMELMIVFKWWLQHMDISSITSQIFPLNQTQPYILEKIFCKRIYSLRSQLILLYHLIMCLDHKSCAETGQELMRPYLHEFLTSAYEDYDIVIWCMELLSSFFLFLCTVLSYSNYQHILVVHSNFVKYSNCTCAVCFSCNKYEVDRR